MSLVLLDSRSNQHSVVGNAFLDQLAHEIYPVRDVAPWSIIDNHPFEHKDRPCLTYEGPR